MKTITVYGSGSGSSYRVDHVTLDRDNASIDDDSWNTLVAVISHLQIESIIDESISASQNGFDYTFPITL